MIKLHEIICRDAVLEFLLQHYVLSSVTSRVICVDLNIGDHVGEQSEFNPGLFSFFVNVN